MRITKYRCWDGFNGEYTYSEMMGLSKFFNDYEMRMEGDNNCSLEQYTGLKDKNGVEIYEGDKTTTGIDGIYEICAFHKGMFGWESYEEGDSEIIEFDSMDSLLLDRVEIIGNIHTKDSPSASL